MARCSEAVGCYPEAVVGMSVRHRRGHKVHSASRPAHDGVAATRATLLLKPSTVGTLRSFYDKSMVPQLAAAGMNVAREQHAGEHADAVRHAHVSDNDCVEVARCAGGSIHHSAGVAGLTYTGCALGSSKRLQ